MNKKVETSKIKCPVDGCDYEGDTLEISMHLEEKHGFEKEKINKWIDDRDAMKLRALGRSLVDAAKEAGAIEIISEMTDSVDMPDEVRQAFDRAPTTQDILGTGKIEFHKELPQIEFDNLVGHEFLLLDVRMVEGWDGYFGTSNFGLIMLQLRDGRKATSLGGGVAIVKQLRQIQAKRRYPVKVTLTTRPGQAGDYKIFE